jgi:hypothetical protein
MEAVTTHLEGAASDDALSQHRWQAHAYPQHKVRPTASTLSLISGRADPSSLCMLGGKLEQTVVSLIDNHLSNASDERQLTTTPDLCDD